MSALDDVIAGIHHALDKSAEARHALRRAAQVTDEALDRLGAVLEGSSDPEAAQVTVSLARGSRDIDDVYRTIVAAEAHMRAYLSGIGADSVTTADVDSAPAKNDRIQRLRAELPPDVPPPDQRAPGMPRPKTHGRWFTRDGQVRAVVSGEDDLYAESVKAFHDLGLRRMPVRASDVELKLAAYMRNHGIRSATVLINNTPCPGPYGCDALVPVLLPEGCTLTVHGAGNFTKTYRGGTTPPWHQR
jgi:hypothetical protein